MNVVQPGHSLYAGIFRNPEIVKVFSEKVALISLNYSAVSRRLTTKDEKEKTLFRPSHFLYFPPGPRIASYL
jgi:hypothetical protein